MNIKEANTAVIYERVSSQRQANENNSLANQMEATKAHCERNGWQVITVFNDPGKSGRSIERPGFQQMLAFCKEKRIRYVVVYDLSRFARNATDQGNAIAELTKRGTLVRSVSEPNVDETSAGRFAGNVIAASNQLFSDALSERTQERMRFAFESGRYLRGAPVGYNNVRRAPQGQANIVPDEVTAPLVSKAFELMATGNDSPSGVLKTMTAMGLRSKKGKRLSLHSFLNLLRNPAYIGMVRSNKYRETRRGLHRAIVEKRTFQNVQLILSGKKAVVAPYSRNRADFPLRRFLRCNECGTPLTGGASRSATGKTYDYYNCYKCHAVKSLSANKAAAEFSELLKHLQPSAMLISEFPAVLKAQWKVRMADNEAVVHKLRADLQERRESQAKLLAKYLNDDKNIVPYFEQMNRRFQEEIAALESQIAEADAEKATFEQLWEFSKSLLVDISTAWQKADVSQKQKVQNVLFPNGLRYDPEKGILNSENDCLFNRLENFVSGKMNMARPERFELPTFWFVARRSIQLS